MSALTYKPSRAAVLSPRSFRAASLRWLLALGLAAILLAQLPLALAWCCGPPDLVGLGTFWFVNDFAQYESAMDQAARSPGWLIYNRFTPEPHQPALMFVFYVALGKLAAPGLPPELAYRAAELLGRLALVASLAAFFVWLLGAGRTAVLAFALSLFGMGLGAPMAIAGSLFGLDRVYTGNGSYEVNTFGLLFSAPHASLAMAVTLVLPIAFDAYLRGRQLTWLAALGTGGLILALLHPFHVPVLLLALAALGWLHWRRGAAAPFRIALAVGAPAVLALPILAYSAATFQLDPFWGATYSAQNLLPSPLPWQLPVDFGIVLPLAAIGALVVLRSEQPLRPADNRSSSTVHDPRSTVHDPRSTVHDPRSTVQTWLLLWIALMLLAMYLPAPFQRRLSFGLQPALAALAALGLVYVETWARSLGRAGLARWLRPAALGLAFTTTATVAAGLVASALYDEPMRPYRATAAEAEAAAWLAGELAANQVVLAAWDTSNYLAGRLPGRVVGGHPVATLNPDQRAADLVAFFSGGEVERRTMVETHRVDYVFYGSREQALGRLDTLPWLQAVYERSGVAVYSVERGG